MSGSLGVSWAVEHEQTLLTEKGLKLRQDCPNQMLFQKKTLTGKIVLI
jgi:hypothetical protein